MGAPFVGIIHPCKIYGILSTGPPFVLIGPKRSPLNKTSGILSALLGLPDHVGDIITESGIGYQVDHADVNGLRQVIDKARNLSATEKTAICRAAQALVQRRYSRKILTKHFITSFLIS